jgi:hypothetical protein
LQKAGKHDDWKLILQLPLFGLFMGVATVYFIPLNVEPFCWLVIFLFCAYVIGLLAMLAGKLMKSSATKARAMGQSA